jgi:pimeloyl-ACP methyl ester carboxylesterase
MWYAGGMTTVDYDEFASLTENATELGLPDSAIPPVRRVETTVSDAQALSALEWGGDPAPGLVFLHGGGQNAHTWDSVLLALGRPALAIDLPGHGHSSHRSDREYTASRNAVAVAAVLEQRASTPAVVIGMSLGGLTTISLAAQFPDLVRAMAVIDVTPQSPARAAELSRTDRGTVALVTEDPVYDSFDSMAAAAIAASPRRSPQAVRRGVRHNARELADGRWTWRYDKIHRDADGTERDLTPGWEELAATRAPMMLVLGGASGFVHPDDVTEVARRRSGVRVETVPDSGHSVQSDQPLALVRLLAEFIDASKAAPEGAPS